MGSGPALVMRVVTRLNVGGPTRQVASLMSRLDPARFAQILVSGRAADDESPGLLEAPGERIDLPELARPIAPRDDWRAYRKLVALFERMRPAVVHTHQAKAGWVGRMAAAAAGVPVIVHTYHGHTFRGYFGWPMGPLLRRFERMAAARSSALVAQADAQAEDVARFLGPAARSKTRVILPGIELPPEPARRQPRAGGRVRIVFPARLEPVKDPMLALEVLRALPEDHELHVFGDGSLRARFESAARGDATLAGRVFVHAPASERAELFRAADVTLLTSREEGTPLVLLESQAFGVPVVATDVGAVRSVVGEGGGRVVARDARAIAAAVREVAETGASASAAEWVRARFSAARMAADVAALYDELRAAAPDVSR